LFGFDISKIDKVIGIENKEWKGSFETYAKTIYEKHQSKPDLFKQEDWMDQSKNELRKSFIQYLGDYVSKFRKVGWNHGNNVIYLFIYLFISFKLFFFLRKKNFIFFILVHKCSHLRSQ